jgi:hypothetical protein
VSGSDDGAAPENEGLSAVARSLVEQAIAPYREVVPEAVLDAFVAMLKHTLRAHPVGVGFVARLEPATLVRANLSSRSDSRDFDGYAFAGVIRAMHSHVRASGEHDPARVVLPDSSFGAAQALLGYLTFDASTWRLDDAAVRAAAARFCDSVVAALFFGWVRDLDARGGVGSGSAETVRAMEAAYPAARGVLDRATAKLSGKDQRLLADLRAAGWDMATVAARSGVRERVAYERTSPAIAHLAVCLRGALAAAGVRS